MHFAEEEILIGMLDGAGFERAQSAIDGFQQHESYEDYRCDREGRLLGLAFAGQRARLVPVSIDHFLAWSASTGEPATAARLDAFVALIEAFRRDPKARPRPFLAPGAMNESIAGRDSFSVPIDSASYEDGSRAWARDLRSLYSTPMRAYSWRRGGQAFAVDSCEIMRLRHRYSGCGGPH